MRTKILPFLAIVSLLLSNFLHAQVVRDYGLIYSDNLKGGHTMFGNTSMAAHGEVDWFWGLTNTHKLNTTAMNQFESFSGGRTSDHANDNYYMNYVDVDNTNTTTSFIEYGDKWSYHDQGSKPSNWPNVTALAQDPKATPLYYTSDNNRNISERTTHYFVKQVQIPSTAAFSSFTLMIDYESGFIIYINGVEKARYNVSGSKPEYNVVANKAESGTKTFTLSASDFVAGTNTIQVEMKNRSTSSSSDDTKFNLKLIGNPVNTFNSSQADLLLPAGTNTIKFARLYWGGKYSSGAFTDAQLKSVKIRKGTSGVYGTINATNVDKAASSGYTAYQSYADITNFIKANGAGTYTVADISASIGSSLTGGGYAGWSIVVVYENTAEPYRSVRIYDGYLEVEDGATRSITLSGLDVPNNNLALEDAYMSTMAWEGDAYLAATTANPKGDFIKVNNHTVSNGVNPATNMWNGTISKNGAHVTSKFPNYKNQMGIDIDEMQVGTGYGINPGAKTVKIEFGTESDQYFPSLFAFSIRMKDPVISINKAVQDLNGGKLLVDDELMYTLSGKNTGQGMAYNVVITDMLPEEVEYITNSLQEWNGSAWVTATNATYNSLTRTGTYYVGTDATPSSGGKVAVNAEYKVRFKVKVKVRGTIINIASITGDNGAGVAFTDEGTAIIGFDEAPLAIKLGSFKAEKKQSAILLQWQTVTETNNDRFEIERSTDGLAFVNVGTVKGNGTTTVAHNYQFNDPLIGISTKMVYYRLKDIDYYNKATYSKIISVRLDEMATINNVTVYPNPFVSQITFTLSSARSGKINVNIINQNGQKVSSQQVSVQTGSNLVHIANLQALKAGIYILQVINESQVITQKIVKR